MSSRYTTVFVSICICLLFSFLASTAIADEQKVYESLAEISIGKVFFSQQQRARLDAQRTPASVRTSAGNSSGKQRHKKVDKNAAGFIMRSGGLSKVYANGEFVTSGGGETIVFPGTVKVVRGQDTDSTKASDDED